VIYTPLFPWEKRPGDEVDLQKRDMKWVLINVKDVIFELLKESL